MKTFVKIMAFESFESVKFDLLPQVQGKVGRPHHTKTIMCLLYIGPWAWDQIKYASFPPFFNCMKVLISESCGFCTLLFSDLNVVANLVVLVGWGSCLLRLAVLQYIMVAKPLRATNV